MKNWIKISILAIVSIASTQATPAPSTDTGKLVVVKKGYSDCQNYIILKVILSSGSSKIYRLSKNATDLKDYLAISLTALSTGSTVEIDTDNDLSSLAGAGCTSDGYLQGITIRTDK
jgi:hypothetical protein